MKYIGVAVLFLGLSSGAARAQALIISQVVDGEVWQTTFVLTNTTAATAHASLSCFPEIAGNATIPWNLTFAETSTPQSISLAPGETLLLHTPGPTNAPSPAVGWCQVTGDAGVVSYAIFTKRPAGAAAQVGTSPAIAAASRILVPFDNTNNNVASMALANTSLSLETINVNIRTTGGTVMQTTLANIPPQGHIAFTFPGQFGNAVAGQSGLAEFYTSSGTFSVLALNFNPQGSLTTAPVYNQSGPPIITGSGSAESVTFAGFSVGKLTTAAGFPPSTPELAETIGGQFASYSNAEWTLPYSSTTIGSCTVLNLSYPTGGKDPSYPDSFLDAGAIAVSGPGLPPGSTLTKTVLAQGPIYSLSPSAGTFALGGTYMISSAGGTQVGPFSTSATLPNSFMVTNWNSITAINRATPVTVNWTGSGFDLVIIHVGGLLAANSTTTNVTVSCAVAANLGTYTVPTAALAMLPATSTGFLSLTAGQSSGGTVSAVSSTSQSFTPSLVGGGSINYGSFSAFLGTSKTLAIQ
jgi:hypothetical protein